MVYSRQLNGRLSFIANKHTPPPKKKDGRGGLRGWRQAGRPRRTLGTLHPLDSLRPLGPFVSLRPARPGGALFAGRPFVPSASLRAIGALVAHGPCLPLLTLVTLRALHALHAARPLGSDATWRALAARDSRRACWTFLAWGSRISMPALGARGAGRALRSGRALWTLHAGLALERGPARPHLMRQSLGRTHELGILRDLCRSPL
jgi:hypothetical protein